MTFLIDENLSHRLVGFLHPAFPGCRHVADFDPLQADDALVQRRALAEGLSLLSKDDDFRDLVERAGPPPKLVFVKLGNVSTMAVAEALLDRANLIRAHLATPEAGILIVT